MARPAVTLVAELVEPTTWFGLRRAVAGGALLAGAPALQLVVGIAAA